MRFVIRRVHRTSIWQGAYGFSLLWFAIRALGKMASKDHAVFCYSTAIRDEGKAWDINKGRTTNLNGICMRPRVFVLHDGTITTR